MTMAGRIAECPISYRQVWYWKDRKHFVLGARSSQLQTWPWTGRIMELHLQWWVSFWCGPSPCCWLDRQKYLSTDCSQLARTALRKLLKGKIRLVERGRLSPPPAPRPHASNTHNCEHLTHNACSRCLLQWRPTNRRRSLFKFFSVRQILPPYIKLLSTAYGQKHAKKKKQRLDRDYCVHSLLNQYWIHSSAAANLSRWYKVLQSGWHCFCITSQQRVRSCSAEHWHSNRITGTSFRHPCTVRLSLTNCAWQSR